MSLTEFDSDRFLLGVLCKRGHTEDGIHSLRYKCNHSCVQCGNEQREANKEKLKERDRNRYLRRDKAKVNAQQRECYAKNKMEMRKKKNDYYHANKDEIRIKKKRYKQSNKGKLSIAISDSRRYTRRKNNHCVPYTRQKVIDRYAEFDHCCAYCGEHPDLITIEHFLPVAKGGADVLGNILPACPRCNYSKSDSSAAEWYRKQVFYSQSRWQRILQVLGKSEATVNQIPLF